MCGNAEAGRIGKQPTNDEADSEEEKKVTDNPQDDVSREDEANATKAPEHGKPSGDKDAGEPDIYEMGKEQSVPSLLDVQGTKFTYVSCGRYHTMAVSVDGSVYCWGKNTEGQLGLLGGGDVEKPMRISILEGIFCKMVACGNNHSLILSTAGDVYSCGRDENGKLGHTLMMPGEKLTDLKCEFQPRKVGVI